MKNPSLFMLANATSFSPNSWVDNPFRGNIPTYTAPDRAEWARDHGAPVELEAAGAAHVERARLLLSRDFSTLAAEEAIEAQTTMESLCERVLARSNLDFDEYLCFYDSETNSFWAYPL